MNAYRITDWDSKYEVGPEGKPTNEQTKRYRKSSLPFVRLKTFSESNGMAYRKLLRLAGKDAPATFGFFCMFLEIAANRDRAFRGWLLDEQQKPLSAEDLAFEFGCENQIIEKTLAILTDERINWLKLSDFKTNDDSAVKLLYNETEENETKPNDNETQPQKTPADIELEKVARQIRGRAIHQTGNLDSSMKNILKDTSSDSDSPKDGYRQLLRRWILGLSDIFPQNKFGKSNLTTFTNMFNWLYDKNQPFDNKLLDNALALAGEVKIKPDIDNPLAYFVSRFKAQFGDFTKATP
jgi:hypothetical protein